MFHWFLKFFVRSANTSISCPSLFVTIFFLLQIEKLLFKFQINITHFPKGAQKKIVFGPEKQHNNKIMRL